jgi:large subunit ribosomal protein L25
MEQQTLSLEIRESRGKGPGRRLRREGKLPGVLYGMGRSTAVTVDPKVIRKYLLTEGGRNQIFNLEGAGLAGKHALIKDYQVDPLSRHLVHVDLIEIDVSKKISVTVKLAFVGKAAGGGEKKEEKKK